MGYYLSISADDFRANSKCCSTKEVLLGNYRVNTWALYLETSGVLLGECTGAQLGNSWDAPGETKRLLLRANCGTALLLLGDSEDYLVTKNTTGQLGQCVKCDYLENCKEYYSKTAGGWGLQTFRVRGLQGYFLGTSDVTTTGII